MKIQIDRSSRFAFVGLCVAAFAGASHAQNCSPQAFAHSLSPSGLSPDARYGAAISASHSGTLVAVGAPDDQGGKGRVVIHELVDGTWTTGSFLSSPVLAAGDHFGTALALDGDDLVVGAPGDDTNGAESGAVYVFHHDAGPGTSGWSFVKKLFASNPAAGDHFGSSLSLALKRFVVGAPDSSELVTHQGMAYLYQYNGSDWVFLKKLTPPIAQINERFGSSVSIVNGQVAVGGPGYDNPSPFLIDSGRVAVYEELAGGVYLLSQTVVPSDPVSSGRFGTSLALDWGILVVGAPGAHNPSGQSVGAVYRYVGSANGYTEKNKWIPGAGLNGTDSGFGTTLGYNGAYAVLPTSKGVHVLGNNGLGVYSDMPSLKPPYADFTPGPYESLGTVVAISNNAVFCGRPSAGPGDVGRVFPFEMCAGTWTSVGAGTPGANGVPFLSGAGPLEGGLGIELRLEHAKPFAVSLLLVHLGTASNLWFHGGSLYSFPINLSIAVPTSATGGYEIPAVNPPGLAGIDFTLQALTIDPSGIGGITLSNAATLGMN